MLSRSGSVFDDGRPHSSCDLSCACHRQRKYFRAGKNRERSRDGCQWGRRRWVGIKRYARVLFLFFACTPRIRTRTPLRWGFVCYGHVRVTLARFGFWNGRFSDRLTLVLCGENRAFGFSKRACVVEVELMGAPLPTPTSDHNQRGRPNAERQERRKRRYATLKHLGGYRNVPVKPP